jgi:hypothetical protein
MVFQALDIEENFEEKLNVGILKKKIWEEGKRS